MGPCTDQKHSDSQTSSSLTTGIETGTSLNMLTRSAAAKLGISTSDTPVTSSKSVNSNSKKK